jgi:hypothetical protein
VIGSIIEALPKVAAGAPRYGASGAIAGARMRPMALSARA